MIVETGLEVFLRKDFRKFQKLRLGVLINQASVDRKLAHARDLVLKKRPTVQVTCFLGPQHGIRGEKQDDMKESHDFVDPASNLPVYSLYGKTREPSDLILEKIDAFLIDLQDIGTRIYTFMTTMAYCMQAAAKAQKKVIVLDRPNPINGVAVEGNVLEQDCSSFVGKYPVAVRHGMTIGELALLFNDAFGIKSDLSVIKLAKWNRKTFADSWGRDWVAPSPNIPSLTAALLFPGMVLFEGTNVSEGRGTTKPFEWIGAPFIDPDLLAREMARHKLKGVYFRPIYFQPTYQKWKDAVCGGVQIHITDRTKLNAFKVGLTLLQTIYTVYPNDFKWKAPPYEYEFERMPIDLIAGTKRLRESVEKGTALTAFHDIARKEAEKFRKLTQQYLLY